MTNSEHSSSGFALAAVLGFLLLVAALLAPLAISSHVRALTAANAFERERLSLAASAVNMRLAAYFAENPTIAKYDSLITDHPAYCRIGRIEATISTEEQHSLVDLNFAGPELLAAGMEAIGLNAADADLAAGAVRSFRSPSTIAGTNLNDARLVAPDGAKHGPFEDVIELQEIPILRTFAPATLTHVFTVHSKNARVASRFADARLSATARSRGMVFAEGASAASPVYRFTTTLRTAGGRGSNSAIFTLDTAGPRLVTSDSRSDGDISPNTQPACRETFWPSVRDLLTQGLGA